LFASLCHLKFDEDEKASAAARSRHLLTFHAIVCDVCHRDKEVCREMKLKKICSLAKRGKLPRQLSPGWAPPEEIRKLVESSDCKPLSLPILDERGREIIYQTPAWYVECRVAEPAAKKAGRKAKGTA
jgi:hypothetical protein